MLSIDVLAGVCAEAVAVKPVLLVVGLPAPPVAVSGGFAAPTGTVQVTNVCPAVQDAAVAAIRVSLPKLPVSVSIPLKLTKRCPVVLT
jgi:hypothetical protein